MTAETRPKINGRVSRKRCMVAITAITPLLVSPGEPYSSCGQLLVSAVATTHLGHTTSPVSFSPPRIKNKNDANFWTTPRGQPPQTNHSSKHGFFDNNKKILVVVSLPFGSPDAPASIIHKTRGSLSPKLITKL